MRVLDVGCSDAAITKWIGDHLEVEIDGLDLDPAAITIAQTRLNGEVRSGRAEDAPFLFIPGTYDAVIAYELIEHVPDIPLFLSALEEMLVEDGTIYLSTPDGAFGDGHNPIHLRALRSIDLADILTRRGKLTDFQVGSDGVTIAAYTPAPRRGEIAIYCGPGWEPWHPIDIITRGLGGSETAAWRLAEALNNQGYVVTIYGHFSQVGCMQGVMLKNYTAFDPTTPRLAVISSRIPEVFDRPVNATSKLLIFHDTDAGPRLNPENAEQIDRVICLSQWHQQHITECYPFIAGKTMIARNGITHSFFQGDPPERENRVLYTSSPDRGLDLLLELWPQILSAVPDAELFHTYAPVYDRVAEQSVPIREHRDRIRRLADQPGVTSISGLSQPKLANLMRTAKVWAHPSYSSPAGVKFHETYCIGAVEAQAAGCRVVAGAWGALPETVRTGALIDGDPTSIEWRQKFVQAIIDGLTEPEVAAIAATGPAEVASLDWAGVGDLVASLLPG